MYLVFARKYRPQTFEEVVGQGPIARTLQNAIRLNRVAHAYLFTGSRGVGKTSMARILAKALNCEKGPTTEPCCQCGPCKAIATGEDIDVIEMDAASNRGIEEIRQLRQNVKYAPSRCRYKIYIIDEAHQLTGPAFNALLKTLEEPPPHVIFILATTDPQKLPETVVARCQRFDFRRISVADIVERLRQICQKEGVTAQPGALELIARHARGGMRDAQGALDQICSFGGKEITVEDVRAVLGVVSGETICGFFDAIIAQDAARALKIVQDAIDRGQEIGDFVDQVTNYARDVLVLQHCGPDPGLIDANLLDLDAARRHAESLSREALLYIMQLLQGVRNNARNDPAGRTMLELAVLKMLHLKDLQDLSTLTAMLESAIGRGAPPGAGGAGQAPRKTGGGSSWAVPGGSAPARTGALRQAAVAGDINSSMTKSTELEEKIELTAENLPRIKQTLVESLRGEGSKMLSQTVASCDMRIEKGGVVLVSNSSVDTRINEKETREKLSAALKRLTGGDVAVRVEAGSAAAGPGAARAGQWRGGGSVANGSPAAQQAVETAGAAAGDDQQRLRKLQRAGSPALAREAAQDAQLMQAYEAMEKQLGFEPSRIEKEAENEQ